MVQNLNTIVLRECRGTNRPAFEMLRIPECFKFSTLHHRAPASGAVQIAAKNAAVVLSSQGLSGLLSPVFTMGQRRKQHTVGCQGTTGGCRYFKKQFKMKHRKNTSLPPGLFLKCCFRHEYLDPHCLEHFKGTWRTSDSPSVHADVSFQWERI